MGSISRQGDERLPQDQPIGLTEAVICSRRSVETIDDLRFLFGSRGARVEVTPVTGEAITGDTATFAWEDHKVEFSSWRNARVCGGVADNSYAIGSFLRSQTPNRLLNKEVTPGSLVWAPAGAERDAIYASPVEGAFVHVPADRFEQLLEERGFKGDIRSHRIALWSQLDPLAHFIVGSSIRTRAALLQWSNGNIPERSFKYAFDHLLDNFLDCAALALGTRYEAREATVCHTKLLKRVEDILIERQGEIHSVNGLCDSLRVSRSTLQRAFNDILGVSPHVYLRNWRLARAREHLISGRAGSVAETAIYWGFFDKGRFAGYYRKLFGELPSDTLRKR